MLGGLGLLLLAAAAAAAIIIVVVVLLMLLGELVAFPAAVVALSGGAGPRALLVGLRVAGPALMMGLHLALVGLGGFLLPVAAFAMKVFKMKSCTLLGSQRPALGRPLGGEGVICWPWSSIYQFGVGEGGLEDALLVILVLVNVDEMSPRGGAPSLLLAPLHAAAAGPVPTMS